MYYLITIALSGIAGFTWGWTHRDWHMPYWALVVFSLGPALIADLAVHVVKRRRARRTRPHRRAHARPNPKTHA